MDVEMEKVAPTAGEDVFTRKKPPEGGSPPQRMSFKEKLMGGKDKQPNKERIDLFDAGKMRVEYVDDNPTLPRIRVDKSIIESMCAPWKEALVVCLLGKRLGYRTMKAKLESTWKPTGGFDLMDVDNGFYLVTFDQEEDKNKVMGGGPWMIFDHYLAVSTWSAEFISPAARVLKTLAWIRIPGLNVAFYDESFLLSVARVLGKPIKVDINTLSGDRGRFARICIELDLTKAVIGRICIEDFWYKVEYEGRHVICTKCGCYGHRSRECKGAPPMKMQKPTTEGVPLKESGSGVPTERQTQATTAGAAAGAQARMEMEVQKSTHENVAPDYSNGPQSQAENRDVASIAVKPNNQNPTMDAAEVEILGDWMTVTKKKKKVLRSGSNNGGTNPGKIAQKEEQRKPTRGKSQAAKTKGVGGGNIPLNMEFRKKEEKVGTPIAIQSTKGTKSGTVGPFTGFPTDFQVGSSSTDWLHSNNKKRRTRPGVNEKRGGPSLGPLQILSHPVGDPTKPVVFGVQQFVEEKAQEHMQCLPEQNVPMPREGGGATPGGE
ncbi:uncharacterized protein LOC130729242 [Lotus japonicus]|uniref:uncharacterized protein LOC130729242 n=1 Tax=Lotus japonicus TaxID=34305 RepID=UPI00258997F5|nr:uncharacterized protein LOC130729242 [Lotus japonicus]